MAINRYSVNYQLVYENLFLPTKTSNKFLLVTVNQHKKLS